MKLNLTLWSWNCEMKGAEEWELKRVTGSFIHSFLHLLIPILKLEVNVLVYFIFYTLWASTVEEEDACFEQMTWENWEENILGTVERLKLERQENCITNAFLFENLSLRIGTWSLESLHSQFSFFFLSTVPGFWDRELTWSCLDSFFTSLSFFLSLSLSVLRQDDSLSIFHRSFLFCLVTLSFHVGFDERIFFASASCLNLSWVFSSSPHLLFTHQLTNLSAPTTNSSSLHKDRWRYKDKDLGSKLIDSQSLYICSYSKYGRNRVWFFYVIGVGVGIGLGLGMWRIHVKWKYKVKGSRRAT